MIPEVGAALHALFGPLLPDGATVRLGPPPEGGRDVLNLFVLNLFLVDVREDRRGAAADWDDVRDEHGVLLGRRPPIRRFELCYLVTAWAGDGYQESELLDAVLVGAVPEQRIDPKLLTGALAESPAPVLVRLADGDADPHRVYGLPARTTLALVVNAPLVRALDTDLAKPAERLTVEAHRGTRRGPEAGPRRRVGRWSSARVEEQPEGGADATSGQAG